MAYLHGGRNKVAQLGKCHEIRIGELNRKYKLFPQDYNLLGRLIYQLLLMIA